MRKKICHHYYNTAARSEIARRSKDTADRMKERMREAKEEVETEQQNKLDISSGKLSSELTIIISQCLCSSFRAKLVTKLKQIGDLTTQQVADISFESYLPLTLYLFLRAFGQLLLLNPKYLKVKTWLHLKPFLYF